MSKSLSELLTQAQDQLSSMSPEERAAMWEVQRRSWVRGEMGLCETSMMKPKEIREKVNGKTVAEWREYLCAKYQAQQPIILHPHEFQFFIDAIEARDRRIAWQERLLTWCRARLSRAEYQNSLDKYRADGPTEPDTTPMVQS